MSGETLYDRVLHDAEPHIPGHAFHHLLYLIASETTGISQKELVDIARNPDGSFKMSSEELDFFNTWYGRLFEPLAKDQRVLLVQVAESAISLKHSGDMTREQVRGIIAWDPPATMQTGIRGGDKLAQLVRDAIQSLRDDLTALADEVRTMRTQAQNQFAAIDARLTAGGL